MKILFIVPRYHTNMHEWINILLKHNHKIFVNTLISNDIENHSLVKPTKFKLSILSKYIIFIFGKGGENLKRGFPNIISYFIYIKKLKPEVIIVRDLSRWFSILGIILSKLLRVKLIIYSQNKIYDKFTKKRIFIHNLICFIFNPAFMSPILGKRSQIKFKLKNTFHIPFAGYRYRQEKVDNGFFNILTIGKFVKRKNQSDLINIIINLKEKYSFIRLTVLGECYEPIHYNLLKTIELKYNTAIKDGYIKIFTNVPHENIKNYYNNIDLFVLPATEEPASISIIESLSNEIPTICSNTCGTAEYIDVDKNGLIFEDNNMDDLKSKIEYYIKKNIIKESLPIKFYFDGVNFYSYFKKMMKNHFNFKL